MDHPGALRALSPYGTTCLTFDVRGWVIFQFSGPHEAYYLNPFSNKTDTCGRGFNVGGSWRLVKKVSQEFPFSLSFQNEAKTPDRGLLVTTLTHFNRFLLYSRGFIQAH